MKCVVVGNSPSVRNLGDTINDHDIIIRTGIPIVESYEAHVGNRTDIIVTRDRKFSKTSKCIIDQFDYKYEFIENELNPLPGSIHVLCKCKTIIDINILNQINNLLKLTSREKPTLGIIAILIAAELYNRVNICGIETEYNSPYFDRGHYDDDNYRRVNDHHSLVKELLYINKLIRHGTINLL